MANLKTMKAASEAVASGKTRAEVAKRYKVSTSTIDNWREHMKAATKATEGGRTLVRVAKTRTVRKNQTALQELQVENVRLTSLVGRLFMKLMDSGHAS